MKRKLLKFIGSAFVIFVVILMANQILFHFVFKKYTSYYWGEEKFKISLEYLKRTEQNFNTYFIGSSSTYRHIDPDLFDKLADTSLNISSFNLGVNALSPPESYFFYRNFIEEDFIKPKYVLIELRDVHRINHQNYGTLKVRYWYNLENWWFTMRAIFHSNTPIHRKFRKYLNHNFCCLLKLLNVGMIGEIDAVKKQRATDNFDFEKLGVGRNGYYSFEDQTATSSDSSYIELLKFRRREFLKDSAIMQRSKNLSIRKHEQALKKPAFNKMQYETILDLIEHSKSKGIQLIFLFSPRAMPYQFDEIIPLYNQLPDAHKIGLANGGEYPELYDSRTSFDVGHMNKAGSQIYTRLLAEKFNELIQND